jgi:hypothetical protein
MQDVCMLHEFITINREEIVLRCRAKVATRSVPPPTEAEIDHGVPLFLDQLVTTLRGGQDQLNPEISRARPSSSGIHGVAGRARLWGYLPVRDRTGTGTGCLYQYR